MQIFRKTFVLTVLSFAFVGNVFAAKEPPSFSGSGRNSQKVKPSGQRVDYIERKDNTAGKKQSKSQREKREEKGNRVSRDEIERSTLETALNKAIDKEISYMEALLSKLKKKSPQRPEVLRRLVENYHQKGLLVSFLESKNYDDAWRKWDEGGRRGSEPMPSTRESKAWMSKVIQRAQEMITDYPKHKKLDESYFQIAYAFEQLGQRKEAAQYYGQLVVRFPNSRRVPDSHFALGEFYFDKLDFKRALTSYSEVRRFTKTPIYPWAIYKIAWTHFNLGDFKNSLTHFQAVVSLSDSVAGLSKKGRIRLKDEALRDMVNVFAELRDLSGAEKYFAEVGGEKHFATLLLRLATLLRERGEFKEAIRVLKRFIVRNPKNLKAADIQIEVVDTANLIADKDLLWTEIKVLLAHFGPNSQWVVQNKNEPGFHELFTRIHNVAYTYPKKMHATAQKEGNRYLYDQAIVGYTIYLAYYGTRPESVEVRFLLGEIQYGMGKYQDALKTFIALAALKEKTTYFKKASEYVISAAYLSIEKPMKELRARGAKIGQQPIALPEGMKQYIDACQKYMEWFPKDPRVLDCHVDMAEIMLKTNNYAEAEKELKIIIAMVPQKPEGLKSAEVLLYLAQKDSKKLLEVAQELSKVEAFRKGDLGKRLASIKDSARFENTLALEKSGDHQKAAEEFEQIARANLKGPEGDKALFNAGINYRKANNSVKSLEMFGLLVTEHPKSPQNAEALLAIIEMRANRLELDKAAQNSMVFLAKYPKDKRSNTVALETCYLYDALNDMKNIAKVCGDIMKSKSKDSTVAGKTLTDAYERNGNYGEFSRMVDSFILGARLSESEKVDYLSRAAEADRKLNRPGAVERHERQAMGIFNANKSKVTGSSLSAIGKIEFNRQEPLLAKYKASKLIARLRNGMDLQRSIEDKMFLLKKLESGYKKVLATGDSEWGLASLYMLGVANETFSDELSNPPMPPGFPEADAKKLREVLAGAAKLRKEAAKSLYLQAADISAKYGIYGTFARKNSESLARIDEKYKRVDEWLPQGAFVGSKWGRSSESDKALKFVGDK